MKCLSYKWDFGTIQFVNLKKKQTTYAFIDASNIFYGGEKSLGWKIDYRKFSQYLKKKYGVDRIYYFGGVELHGYVYDYIKSESVPIEKVEKYLVDLIKKEGESF